MAVLVTRADEPGSGRVPGARILHSPRWPLASLASAAAVHVFAAKEDVDARDEPAHDEVIH